MTDFFKFRNSLEEAKCGSKNTKREEEKLDPVGKADADIDNDGDVDSSDEYLKNRRKAISKAMKKEDEDGPCWPGYKQVGMKMKDGKEVPNCVPEETQKEQVSEGYYDYPDYGPVGASEMAQTQLHFIKYAADDITRCLKMGCPMPEWYQNKLAKMEGDMEGLYSYMKGKTRKMKAHQADRYSMGMSMYGEETQLNEDWFYDLVGVKMKDLYFVAKKGYRTNKKVYLQTLHSPTNFGTYWVRDPGDATYFIKKRDAEKAAKEHGGKVVTGVTEQAKSSNNDGYDEFFQAALKKFGVKGIGELDKEKKKEFFNYVDKNWKGDKEETINEVLKPSDDVSTWIEDFYKSDAPQFKGKNKEERREMAVAAWLGARREAGYDVDPNPNKD